MPASGRNASGRVTGGVLALALAASLAACGDDQFKGAQAEVGREKIKPTLPAVPSFEIPPANPDGSHTVKEMRIKGRKFLEQEIKIKGYVTWIYDCPTALRSRGISEEEVQRILKEDPMQCSRPKFRLGDTADAGEDRTVKVVEVPRFPTEQERKVFKEEIKDPTIWRPVPQIKVGDEVVVTGAWKVSSGRGDSDMAGLLVYGSLENLTTPWSTATVLAELEKKKR
jgi:hypothetical protein